MGLSCDCDGDYDSWYVPADDYSTLQTKRSRKCPSCRERIAIGATVLALHCWRNPLTDAEESIYGYDGEVPLATRYLCERCADLYLSLSELGFCMNMGDDMRELVKEYAEVYGPQRHDTSQAGI